MSQKPKDAVLLFEIGFNTQAAWGKSDGLTRTRLNKTLAVILWHWEQLQKTAAFRGIHNWGIYHMPYRHGEVVYRPSPTSTSQTDSFNMIFLDEIIRTDPTMQLLIRLNSLSGFEEDNFYFHVPDLNEYQKIKELADIEERDIDLARYLALLYASVDTEDLAIVATCSDEECAYRAMETEIKIWHHDVQEIFRKLFEYRSRPVSVQNEIAKHLDDAFKCGQQIGVKRKWYVNADNVASLIVAQSKDRFPMDLLEPLSKIKSKSPSSRMQMAEEAAKSLTGLIGFCNDLFAEIGLRVNLPGEAEKIAQGFEAYLYDPVGYPTHRADMAHIVAGSRKIERAYELLDPIKEAYVYIQKYLRSLNLPDTDN
jgi:hypothetical protein